MADILERIAALVAERHRVGDAADQVGDRLTEAVVEARYSGHSWERIAQALGISRQLAMYHYRDKARQGGR